MTLGIIIRLPGVFADMCCCRGPYRQLSQALMLSLRPAVMVLLQALPAA